MLVEETSNYPRTPIPTDYWEDFGIEYLDFIRDMKGETKRVRGEPKREVVPNITMHTQHVVTIPDNNYKDLWFCGHQIKQRWDTPKRRLSFQWPVSRSA